MRNSGNEPSSVILSQTELFQRLKMIAGKRQNKLKQFLHFSPDGKVKQISGNCTTSKIFYLLSHRLQINVKRLSSSINKNAPCHIICDLNLISYDFNRFQFCECQNATILWSNHCVLYSASVDRMFIETGSIIRRTPGQTYHRVDSKCHQVKSGFGRCYCTGTSQHGRLDKSKHSTATELQQNLSDAPTRTLPVSKTSTKTKPNYCRSKTDNIWLKESRKQLHPKSHGPATKDEWTRKLQYWTQPNANWYQQNIECIPNRDGQEN